jgi:hypothetical protein
MNRRNALQGLARMTTGLGVGMGSMLANTATAQPQTLRMGGADVPIMPNPEARRVGTIPGTTFVDHQDKKEQPAVYQQWTALIPKLLQGFDKEWIFDFPSVVLEFQLWAPYPSLDRYDPRLFTLATALLPGSIHYGGRANKEASMRFSHGFDRRELVRFLPPNLSFIPQPDWCIDADQVFHQITVMTGLRPTMGTRGMPSSSDGRSSIPFSWTVPRKSADASGQLKRLVATRREGIRGQLDCSLRFIAELVTESPSPWNTPGVSK